MERNGMERSAVGRNLAEVREARMWTPGRLAQEAGGSSAPAWVRESGGRRGAVGRTLGEVREARMWAQVRLAQEAGVSPTTVSGIESGRISRPHFGTLRKLAAALEVEPERLLSASGAGRDVLPSRL